MKSPSLMKGYKDNPTATAECYDQHGYFCTGDLAYIDQDGYFFVVGRLQELLAYRGTKVCTCTGMPRTSEPKHGSFWSISKTRIFSFPTIFD